jgi:hypothetical protein
MEARRGETKGLAAQHDSPARPQDGRRPTSFTYQQTIKSRRKHYLTKMFTDSQNLVVN